MTKDLKCNKNGGKCLMEFHLLHGLTINKNWKAEKPRDWRQDEAEIKHHRDRLNLKSKFTIQWTQILHYNHKTRVAITFFRKFMSFPNWNTKTLRKKAKVKVKVKKESHDQKIEVKLQWKKN